MPARAGLLVVAACLLAVVGARCAGAGTSAAAAAPCTGTQLTSRFAVVPGSPGAGNVSYRLTLRNRSSDACTIRGLPAVRLLARDGRRLPTLVAAARPRRGATVRLAPGRSAHATARFSPDVPGVGEPVDGSCERTATRLRVTAPGGGAVIVRVTPPTAVCEHGRLMFSPYARA